MPAGFAVNDLMLRLAGTRWLSRRGIASPACGAPVGATSDSNSAPGFWQAGARSLHMLTRRSLLGGAAAMVLVEHGVPGLTSSDRLYPANTLFPGG